MNVLEQDRELVAAEAADGVVRPYTLTQSLGDLDEHAVAHVVAEAVVDDLEAVEVEEQQRRGVVALPRVHDRELELLHEPGTIPQAGEAIVVRGVRQLVLELL